MGDSHPQPASMATELALLLALATLWGASYTFIRIGVATIPPITLIACRTLIAGSLLLAIMRWRGVRMPVDATTWRRFLFQTCLNSVIPWTMVAWGAQALDAGVATILNSTAPIFTFFLTLAITRHEAVTLSGFGEELTAQLAMVIAAICYAGAAILGRGFRDLDPMVPAAGSLLCGAALLIPVSLVLDRPWTLQPATGSMLALAALAVFSTALAFVIYFRLIRTLGSVGTTAQAYLRVPIGVAVGVVFLGEQLSSTAWIGLACVVVGVAAMTIPARKARPIGEAV